MRTAMACRKDEIEALAWMSLGVLLQATMLL